MYKVLAIAPIVPELPPLAVLDELARISDLRDVDMTKLVGPVTKQRIIDQLARESFDAVLWVGHGEPGRLLLSDRERVDPRWLSSQLSRKGIGLAVLAACWSGARQDSTGFVASFVDVMPACGINSIVMMISVEDSAAIEYDVALFQSLATGERLRQAHEVGMEAISSFPGMVHAPLLVPADGQISAAISDLKTQVEQIDGHLLHNHPEQARKLITEMTATLQDLDDKIASTYRLASHTAERVSQLELQLNPPLIVTIWRAMAMLVAIFGFSLLFIKETRDILFAPYILLGIGVEVVILLWAVSLWWLGHVTMNNRRQRHAERSDVR